MRKSNIAATITVEWGYDDHSITITPGDWAAIKAGREHSQTGEGYHHDAQFFWDYWNFGGGLDGTLEVNYGDDGGQGFVGNLRDAIIEEHEYKPMRRRTS